MRVPGYCSSCHRPRRVSVSGAGMASLAFRGVAEGICDECENPKPQMKAEHVRDLLAHLENNTKPLVAVAPDEIAALHRAGYVGRGLRLTPAGRRELDRLRRLP